MLGREGEGSILQVLKERKLARALNVGTSRQDHALTSQVFTVTPIFALWYINYIVQSVAGPCNKYR